MLKFFTVLTWVTLYTAFNSKAQVLNSSLPEHTEMRKVKDIVIYEDQRFHSAFPSIIKCQNGEYLLAFRRAPDRRIYGESILNHVDANSQLVGLRSKDGIKWTTEPELIYANPFGGSQDPCLLKLSDGTIICASYGWIPIKDGALDNLKKPVFYAGGAIFQGGYILRSKDNGKKWESPVFPPHISPEINYTVFKTPVPAYNRGAMYETKDGRVLWIVAATDSQSPQKTSNHLLISNDKGLSWTYTSQVAADGKIAFDEASVIETDKGDIVGFLRSEGLNDQACIARSTNSGKSFSKWESMGFQGHPLQATKLKDGRVLLVYGYRHKPYGIRAKLLNAECTNFAAAPELILRDDGGNGDMGYPWSIQLDNKHILVVYYINHNNNTRLIAGSVIEIKPL